MTPPRISNKAVVRRMQSYGMDRTQALLAQRAVLKAVRELLLEGQAVNFFNFGTFVFRFRRGRTSRPFGQPPKVQADSWFIKFNVSAALIAQLKQRKVIPTRESQYRPLRRATSAFAKPK